MNNFKYTSLIVFLTCLGVCLFAATAPASEQAGPQDASLSVYTTRPTNPLTLEITPEHSAALGFRAGDTVRLQMSVDAASVSHPLLDQNGRGEWEVQLDQNRYGSITLFPHPQSFTGILNVKVNGHLLPEAPIHNGQYAPGRLIEKNLDYVFPDGTRILIHYTDQDLAIAGAPEDFPSKVRDAAVSAYQIITSIQGFQSKGYSFSDPDTRYAYDPDQTIDIYLGKPNGENRYSKLGWKNRLFKDSPCFDTLSRENSNAHDAVIFLPANYHQFIRNWEKMNPSSLGKRNMEIDLRGTLIHEMLHAVLFYYNKNLNKSEQPENAETSQSSRHLDWYVEGLARYFETMAGAKHDFFSQGFKEALPDKIRFSRGGSNYYMRYPDQAFTDLRYENALFWRFLDYRFGMESIERLSREFRNNPSDFRRTLERVTGISHEDLLVQYARAILLNDFGLKDESIYLQEIAKTRLLIDRSGFWIVDGHEKTEKLGHSCQTDWIGKWSSFKSALGQPGAAGDHTEEADISPWASDFIELTPLKSLPNPKDISVIVRESDAPVSIQVFAFTRGGAVIEKKMSGSRLYGHAVKLGIPAMLKKNAMDWTDLEKLCLILTNTHSSKPVPYELQLTD